MKDPQQELPLKHPHGDAKLANAKAALAESVRLIAEAEKHASEVAEELKHSREDSEEDKERKAAAAKKAVEDAAGVVSM